MITKRNKIIKTSENKELKDWGKDLPEKVRTWYESYNEPPSWSSVLGFIVRELSAQKKKITDSFKDIKTMDRKNLSIDEIIDIIAKLKI